MTATPCHFSMKWTIGYLKFTPSRVHSLSLPPRNSSDGVEARPLFGEFKPIRSYCSFFYRSVYIQHVLCSATGASSSQRTRLLLFQRNSPSSAALGSYLFSLIFCASRRDVFSFCPLPQVVLHRGLLSTVYKLQQFSNLTTKS